jgi:hypothetical protein
VQWRGKISLDSQTVTMIVGVRVIAAVVEGLGEELAICLLLTCVGGALVRLLVLREQVSLVILVVLENVHRVQGCKLCHSL